MNINLDQEQGCRKQASDLYKHPEQYDREHLGDEEDIGFYLSLSRSLAPRKILELDCGTGRITLPLAQLGFDVIGLDNQPEMLQKADARGLRSFIQRQRMRAAEAAQSVTVDPHPAAIQRYFEAQHSRVCAFVALLMAFPPRHR